MSENYHQLLQIKRLISALQDEVDVLKKDVKALTKELEALKEGLDTEDEK